MTADAIVNPGTRTAATAHAVYAVSSATSRLNHERRRLRNAFHATAGRPRWNVAPAIAVSASAAARMRCASVEVVALTPAAVWLTTVSHTSGQCGCSGRRFQSLAANVSIGT